FTSHTRPHPHSTIFPYTTLFRSLVYHTISEPHEASPCDEMISPDRFEQQLRWLSRRRRVVPLVETLNRRESERLVAITFDDGYRSEEHTSELQSRGHLVCRLLLE